jgi:hypothetical protein
MKLQQDEKIIKVYHHHKIFFLLRGLKIWMASLPFFLLASVFTIIMPTWLDWTVFTAIIALFVAIQAYDILMYYLDTLVITNQRLVHLDWINPLRYIETQAGLDDIENIESHENGFLSKVNIFDFGLFMIETASTKTIISFPEAPDPEGIKFFVINLSRKHLGVESHHQNGNPGEAYIINKKTESSDSKVAAHN